MRLFDVSDDQQTLMDDGPVFDKTPQGQDAEKYKDFKL